jgi:hypothetical protein
MPAVRLSAIDDAHVRHAQHAREVRLGAALEHEVVDRGLAVALADEMAVLHLPVVELHALLVGPRERTGEASLGALCLAQLRLGRAQHEVNLALEVAADRVHLGLQRDHLGVGRTVAGAQRLELGLLEAEARAQLLDRAQLFDRRRRRRQRVRLHGGAELRDTRLELDAVHARLGQRSRQELDLVRNEVLAILHREREHVVLLLEVVQGLVGLVELALELVDLRAEPLERRHRRAHAVVHRLLDVRVGDRVRDALRTLGIAVAELHEHEARVADLLDQERAAHDLGGLLDGRALPALAALGRHGEEVGVAVQAEATHDHLRHHAARDDAVLRLVELAVRERREHRRRDVLDLGAERARRRRVVLDGADRLVDARLPQRPERDATGDHHRHEEHDPLVGPEDQGLRAQIEGLALGHGVRSRGR